MTNKRRNIGRDAARVCSSPTLKLSPEERLRRRIDREARQVIARLREIEANYTEGDSK